MAGSLFSKAVIEFNLNAQNAIGQVDSFQKKFTSSISTVKSALIGFIGYQGLKAATDSLTRLSDTADKWQIPVEKVSKFSNLFAQFGGSTDEAVSSLENFQTLANDLKFNSSGALRDLSAKLRVNLNNKDFEGVILAIKSQWQYLSKDAKAEVQNIIGASAPLRRMLDASSKDFKVAEDRALRFGLVSENNANAIQKLRVALSEVRQVLTLLAVPVLEILRPFVEVLRDIAVVINDLPGPVKKLAAGLLIFFGVFGKIISLFKVFSLAVTANPIGLIIAGISALIVAGVMLYQNWGKVKKYINDLIKRFPILGKAINFVKAYFTGLFKIIKTVVEWIYKAIEAAKNAGKWLGKFLGFGDSKLTIEQRKAADDELARMGVLPSQNMAQNSSYSSSSFSNDVYNNSNASQTINIYGVKDSGDMMSNLQSMQTQSLIPVR